MHGLIAEKAKLGKPLTFKGRPQHQDHAKMNARILGDAMAMQRQNDQKVTTRARAKGQCEWVNNCCITMSTITKTNFGQISFEASVTSVVLMHGAWEVCLKMQHHGWKRIKIYKR